MEDIETQLEDVFWNATEVDEKYRLYHPETEELCGIIEVTGEYEIVLERERDNKPFRTNIEDHTLNEFRNWVVDSIFG